MEINSNPAPVDWSYLPYDLVRNIAKKVTNYCDLIRFRSVCASWRFAANSIDLEPKLPWPIIPFRNGGADSTTVSIFNPSNLLLYDIEIPETRGKWVYGSSHGWMLIIEPELKAGAGYAVYLLNPITKTQIPLPHLDMTELFLTHLSRVLLCSNPSATHPGQQLLVAVWSFDTLVLLRKGDIRWIVVKTVRCSYFGDIAYFENRLYAIYSDGWIATLDDDTYTMETLSDTQPPAIIRVFFNLVEAPDNLLLLVEELDRFTVFKLEKHERQLKWTKAVDYDNAQLFTSRKATFWIPGVRGNQIYLLEYEDPKDIHSMFEKIRDPICDGGCYQHLPTMATNIRVLDLEDGTSTEEELYCTASKRLTIH